MLTGVDELVCVCVCESPVQVQDFVASTGRILTMPECVCVCVLERQGLEASLGLLWKP